MAFVVYTTRIKGRKAKTIDRSAALLLRQHKKYASRYPFNRQYRAYLDAIKQIAIPDIQGTRLGSWQPEQPEAPAINMQLPVHDR